MVFLYVLVNFRCFKNKVFLGLVAKVLLTLTSNILYILYEQPYWSECNFHKYSSEGFYFFFMPNMAFVKYYLKVILLKAMTNSSWQVVLHFLCFKVNLVWPGFWIFVNSWSSKSRFCCAHVQSICWLKLKRDTFEEHFRGQKIFCSKKFNYVNVIK